MTKMKNTNELKSAILNSSFSHRHSVRAKGIVLTAFAAVMFAIVTSASVYAIPEYAILTGNRCINCHINSAGGGLRNDLGFYSTEGVSLIKPSWIGLEGVINDVFGSNCAIDRKLFYGLDFRLMSARSMRSPVSAAQTSETKDQPLPERKLFPMQLSAQASFHPTTWAFIEGQYNFGPKKYAGQQDWSASINLQPDISYPSLRLGFFSPSLGFNYDDHTVMVRSLPGDVQNASSSYKTDLFIAPYYSEWGAEVRYSAPLWLDLSAGVFGTKSMSEAITYDSSHTSTTTGVRSIIASGSSAMLNARAALTPRFFDDELNVTVGSSVLNAGDFTMLCYFAGFGWQDHIGIMAEHMVQGNKDARQLRCSTAEIFGRVIDPLYLYVRAEYGTASLVAGGIESQQYARQYVFGSKMIIFPFIELRPEFRILDNASAYRTRWTVQMHVFY